MELAPLKKLVLEYAKRGELGQGPHLRRDGDVHQPAATASILGNLGRAYLELKQPATRRCSRSTSLLVTNPAPRRPALVQLGRARAFVAMKKRAEAKAAVAQAMKTEPENAEILALKAQLK